MEKLRHFNVVFFERIRKLCPVTLVRRAKMLEAPRKNLRLSGAASRGSRTSRFCIASHLSLFVSLLTMDRLDSIVARLCSYRSRLDVSEKGGDEKSSILGAGKSDASPGHVLIDILMDCPAKKERRRRPLKITSARKRKTKELMGEPRRDFLPLPIFPPVPRFHGYQ